MSVKENDGRSVQYPLKSEGEKGRRAPVHPSLRLLVSVIFGLSIVVSVYLLNCECPKECFLECW